MLLNYSGNIQVIIYKIIIKIQLLNFNSNQYAIWQNNKINKLIKIQKSLGSCSPRLIIEIQDGIRCEIGLQVYDVMPTIEQSNQVLFIKLCNK